MGFIEIWWYIGGRLRFTVITVETCVKTNKCIRGKNHCFLFFCLGHSVLAEIETVEEREGGSAENHIAEVQCMRAGKPVLPRGFVPLYFVPPGCSAEIGVVDYSSARKSVGRSLRKRFGMYAHIHPVPVRAHILMLFLAGRTHRGSARYQSGCKSRVVGE